MKTLVVVMLALVGLAGCVEETPGIACAEPAFEEDAHNPIVGVETELGCIYIEVFEDKVPNTALNFLSLVEDGEYDGSPFHRIITNFMMQGGDYTKGNGQGGKAHPDADPDGDGNIVDEYTPELSHSSKGTLSMANTGRIDSGGSQFFITFGPTPHLDAYENGVKKNCGQPQVSCHAVFGQVVAGLDVVDAVNAQASSRTGTPVSTVTFLKGTVYEAHSHEEGH